MSTSISALVENHIPRLQSAYLAQDSKARADMAHLRQAVAQRPGTDPAIWDLTLEGLESPEWHQAEVTAAEWALHLAMTMYAVHQQSQKSPMHVKGKGFGSAIHDLGRSVEHSDKGVRRRMEAFVTASSPAEAQHHLGALVRLLRSAGIGFDYSRFAQELMFFFIPSTRNRTQLVWARQFSRLAAEAAPTTATQE